MHSDDTSKFGEHYGSYQISTEKSVYSLGLCEMLTGSAELTLHTFQPDGKRICRKWKQPDGTECFYYGQVFSLVPGTTDWFNVIYDGEDTILSLNLFVDIEKGDLNFIE